MYDAIYHFASGFVRATSIKNIGIVIIKLFICL